MSGLRRHPRPANPRSAQDGKGHHDLRRPAFTSETLSGDDLDGGFLCPGAQVGSTRMNVQAAALVAKELVLESAVGELGSANLHSIARLPALVERKGGRTR